MQVCPESVASLIRIMQLSLIKPPRPYTLIKGKRIVSSILSQRVVDEKLSNLDSSYVNDLLSNTKGIIELSQKANRLFLRTSGSEKKQFLKKLLSNCTLDHGTVKPEFQYPLGMLFDANAKWKASGALSSDLCAVHSFWYPKANSNSTSS